MHVIYNRGHCSHLIGLVATLAKSLGLNFETRPHVLQRPAFSAEQRPLGGLRLRRRRHFVQLRDTGEQLHPQLSEFDGFLRVFSLKALSLASTHLK